MFYNLEAWASTLLGHILVVHSMEDLRTQDSYNRNSKIDQTSIQVFLLDTCQFVGFIMLLLLSLYLLVSSADNFCKQFGPRSGPTKCQA